MLVCVFDENIQKDMYGHGVDLRSRYLSTNHFPSVHQLIMYCKTRVAALLSYKSDFV